MKNALENSLLERLQTGDSLALQSVFETQYESVCKVIYRFVQDPGLTEDLAQEVFVRFWQKREKISIDSNLPAYLRKMAANEALAHLRKKTRFLADELPIHLPGHHAPPADENVQAQELSNRITAAINELPPRCRIIFNLSRFEDKTYQEIADELEISIKTVENQMGKALRLLREKLGDYLVVFIILCEITKW